MKLNRMIVTASAFSFALGVSSLAYAQQQAPPAQSPPPASQSESAKTMSLQGELVKVDADAKTISVKTADGAEVLFTYNDKTEVQGAREIAGLATQAGSKVTVQYTADKDKKIATRIEVQPKG